MKLKSDWDFLIQSIKEIKLENMETNLSENLLAYLVAGEDHRFWLHFGFDPIGLLRAAWKSKFHKCREGGSTIAMQLVRTVTGNYEINFKRKLKEIYLATRLTSHLEKSEILKIYLSVAYFGWNMHGIAQACNKLKLDKKRLNEYDAASLIARLKYPEPRYYNAQKSKRIKFRAIHIINRFNELNPVEQYGTI
jgi:membrane peptidoglycan carboxypeptidase